VVWDGGSANGTGGTAGFLQNMGRTLPPMMQVLRDIAGVELPAYLGTMAADPGAPQIKVNGDGKGDLAADERG